MITKQALQRWYTDPKEVPKLPDKPSKEIFDGKNRFLSNLLGVNITNAEWLAILEEKPKVLQICGTGSVYSKSKTSQSRHSQMQMPFGWIRAHSTCVHSVLSSLLRRSIISNPKK